MERKTTLCTDTWKHRQRYVLTHGNTDSIMYRHMETQTALCTDTWKEGQHYVLTHGYTEQSAN